MTMLLMPIMDLMAEFRYDDPSHPAGLERTFVGIFDTESGKLLAG